MILSDFVIANCCIIMDILPLISCRGHLAIGILSWTSCHGHSVMNSIRLLFKRASSTVVVCEKRSYGELNYHKS